MMIAQANPGNLPASCSLMAITLAGLSHRRISALNISVFYTSKSNTLVIANGQGNMTGFKGDYSWADGYLDATANGYFDGRNMYLPSGTYATFTLQVG